jgi:hypothetical protein
MEANVRQGLLLKLGTASCKNEVKVANTSYVSVSGNHRGMKSMHLKAALSSPEFISTKNSMLLEPLTQVKE